MDMLCISCIEDAVLDYSARAATEDRLPILKAHNMHIVPTYVEHEDAYYIPRAVTTHNGSALCGRHAAKKFHRAWGDIYL